MDASGRIGVAGAGSIGCFVGGLLAQDGHLVTCLARPRICAAIRAEGLYLTDYAGLSVTPDRDLITVSSDPACLQEADLVLVTVKTGATPAIAAEIATHVPETAPVISLQNGVSAIEMLRAALPGRDVRAGMVPFNVVPETIAHYHRATSGDIVIGTGPGALARRLSGPHLPVIERADIEAIQWGKLLVNLTNAVNALSGLTVQALLSDRAWRQVLADQMAEALAVLRAAGVPVVMTTPLPARLTPYVLRLPTPIFRRVAARMLTIDPKARTSMSYDLLAGRPTEVDALQGAILALAARTGGQALICARVRDLIRAAEARGPGLPGLAPHDLRP